MNNPQFEESIRKIVSAIKKNNKTKRIFGRTLDPNSLDDEAGNRIFILYYKDFNLTENEAYLVRSFFQSNSSRNPEVYDYIISIIKSC